jgi:hypothetical protein
MSCALTDGRVVDCRNSVGGIKAIYFHNYADLTNQAGWTVAADLVTNVQTAVWTVYKFDVRPELAELDCTLTSSLENGTVYYEQKLTVTLHKLSGADEALVRLLAYGRPNIFVQDNNDNVILLGARNGMHVTGGSMKSGKAFGDLSGFELEFTGKEENAGYFLTPSASASSAAYPFDGLTTDPTIVT